MLALPLGRRRSWFRRVERGDGTRYASIFAASVHEGSTERLLAALLQQKPAKGTEEFARHSANDLNTKQFFTVRIRFRGFGDCDLGSGDRDQRTCDSQLDLSELGRELKVREVPAENDHFEALVVGSGFGGSVMAYRLAEAGLSVAVLERGKSYPPGSFARTPFEMRNNFWLPKESCYGLFDAWSFDHIEALVSAGVGGGSLIYANVLIRKDERWFAQPGDRQPGDEAWPITRKDLDPHYDAVQSMIAPQTYPLEYQRNNKTAAMRAAACRLGIDETTYDKIDRTKPQWYLPLLAITFRVGDEPPIPGERIPGSEQNIHGKPRETCRLCGECDIGCNFGAKNTLDYNYLSAAAHRGAKICELCEVKTIEPFRRSGSSGYRVTFVVHDMNVAEKLRLTVTCDRLILACGTLGTTRLLLRNKRHLPNLSPALGQGFSGNGDYLAFARQCRSGDKVTQKVVAMNASRAPVITSTFRYPDSLDGGPLRGRGVYLQDAGYPLIGDYLWEALEPVAVVRRLATSAWKRVIARILRRRETEINAQLEGVIGRAVPSLSSMPLLGMGRDVPDGKMTLRQGRLQVSWKNTVSKQYIRRVDSRAQEIAEALGGRYDQNPLTSAFNRLITVHPLGGCRMGRNRDVAVVDDYGEVFDYPGLYVADGSVMPGPVGANPSFTIAALADRFATRLLENRNKSRDP
jgi:cholesterol oxidase